MPGLDIADLLRRALQSRGCSQEQVGSFDGHSTIELELSDLPNLNVEQVDDDVWFWSSVAECNSAQLRYCAADLLQWLMPVWPYARTGQMQLAHIDDRLELRVMLGSQALESDESLADALDSFLEQLHTLLGILAQ